MFKCKDCGCEFDEPAVWYDDPSPVGVGLPSGAYVYTECPKCGSGDYTEGKACPICGEEHFGDDPYCEWCLSDAKGVVLYEYEKAKIRYPRLKIDDFIELYEIAIDNIKYEERSKEK